MKNRLLAVAAVSLSASLAACGGGGGSSSSPGPVVRGPSTQTTVAQCTTAGIGALTFTVDLKPIFDAKCNGCHGSTVTGVARQGAPVDHVFDVYAGAAGAQANAAHIDQVAGMNPTGSVKNQFMPPAGAAALTDLERQKIACWVAQGAPEAPSRAALCASYCAVMAATCTGADAQFDAPNDAAACQAACTTAYGWPASDPNGHGDDIACRATHAGLAATALAAGNAAAVTTHCGHAGPTGGGVCGGTCDVYCDLQVANCSAANPLFPAGGTANFTDRAACMTACTAAAFATTGAVGATSGNTFQCRVWHLGKAQAGPAAHCPHTRVVSVTAAGAAGPCN